MGTLMNPAAELRLERSCGPLATDWMRLAPSAPGVERIEAAFHGHAFAPHRHDSYVIGITADGVQSFTYRGVTESSVPGKVFVLHPDELHDGRAGRDGGFRYRSLYLDPALVHDALGETRSALPFVREPVSRDRRLRTALAPALSDLERPLEELERDQLILAVADALAAADPSIRHRQLTTRHWAAVQRMRALLDAHIATGISSAELEAQTGLTRYAAARHFRACLGTSPYRYLLQRRLDRARALLYAGAPLAAAALDSGFADQSHMTRHFKQVYGLSPGRWVRLVSRA